MKRLKVNFSFMNFKFIIHCQRVNKHRALFYPLSHPIICSVFKFSGGLRSRCFCPYPNLVWDILRARIKDYQLKDIQVTLLLLIGELVSKLVLLRFRAELVRGWAGFWFVFTNISGSLSVCYLLQWGLNIE